MRIKTYIYFATWKINFNYEIEKYYTLYVISFSLTESDQKRTNLVFFKF